MTYFVAFIYEVSSIRIQHSINYKTTAKEQGFDFFDSFQIFYVLNTISEKRQIRRLKNVRIFHRKYMVTRKTNIHKQLEFNLIFIFPLNTMQWSFINQYINLLILCDCKENNQLNLILDILNSIFCSPRQYLLFVALVYI